MIIGYFIIFDCWGVLWLILIEFIKDENKYIINDVLIKFVCFVCYLINLLLNNFFIRDVGIIDY